MRIVPALALAALLALPPASAGPAGATDPTGLVIRMDDDGVPSLLLHVEDAPGGTVVKQAVTTPAAAQPHVREIGAYTRTYAGFEGAPTVSAGVYVAGPTLTMRVPLVLVENAESTGAVSAALIDVLTRGIETGNLAAPFAWELLLPEFGAYLGQAPESARASSFRPHPTMYVWNVHRAVPGAEAWAGAYLARDGSVTLDGAGRVASAWADAEMGTATRVGVDTSFGPAAYVRTDYAASPGAQQERVTSGIALARERTPLTTLVLEDARFGGDLATMPGQQATRASVGVHAAGTYVPLAGVETTQTAQASQSGTEVTRVTGVGAFAPDGTFVPVAGMRYHSDSGVLLDALVALVNDGPGAAGAGNFEIDAGAFVDGVYAPLAGIVHRDHFREMRYAYASMVAVGAYTPVGFAPLGVVTYDGSLPLTLWAEALLVGEADGTEWLLAAGTMAAGSYVPLVGVGTIGAAPLQEHEEGYEVRAGVFAGSYRAFVPLASVAYDGDATPASQLAEFALGGTLGEEAGAFDVRVGTYANGQYVALAGATFDSAFEGRAANETMIVLGVYAANGFVPLVGVLYEGDDDLLGSLNGLLDRTDDDRARIYAGVFVLGEWTPVVMVENSGEGVRVLPLP